MNRIETEWMAWWKVCDILENLGVNINKEDELTKALVHWGEELTKLRIEQIERTPA